MFVDVEKLVFWFFFMDFNFFGKIRERLTVISINLGARSFHSVTLLVFWVCGKN